MGTTGRRARTLVQLLTAAGMTPTPHARPESPRLTHLKAYADEISGLYRELGGVQQNPRLAPNGWDSCLDGLIVEFDEEQHFNQFRATTLEPDWTDPLPWQTAYRTHCRDHQDTCLRIGTRQGFWTNDSSEAQFGQAGPRGTLDHPVGPPRWPQRALYDAMRDAYAFAQGTRLARVSVWDVVDGQLLGDVLEARATCSPDALLELVAQRTVNR